MKCNVLSSFFRDKSSIQVKQCARKCVIPLQLLAKQHILKPSYPKDVLVATVCKTHHIEESYKWEAKSAIKLTQQIPGTNITHKAYCYPEYNEKRKCEETTLLDPTLLLTNMHTHCLTKQMKDCLASDFKHVSRADNDVLPRTVLDLMLDKQSAEIALKFFSEDVEKMMEKFEAEDEGKENAKPRNISCKVVKSLRFVRCRKCGLQQLSSTNNPC